MKNNLFLLILVILLGGAAFFAGTLYQKVKNFENRAKAVKESAKQVAGIETGKTQKLAGEKVVENVPAVSKDDHIRGSKDAKIALIEYSDFECPFCKKFHSTAQSVVDEYKGEVMWVYRHFPLALHPNAQMEAEASECAAELGGNKGFWDFTDAIFEKTKSNGTSFTKEQLIDLAAELSFDKAKFAECLNSGKLAQEIKEEMDAGAAAGVTGTPGNILLDINTGKTRLIPGAVPFNQIKPIIDEMLGV